MSSYVAPTASGSAASGSAAPGSAAPAPRWGIQASLIQPRQPAFWLFLVLLGIGGYLFLDEQSVMSQLPTALSLSWGLVLIYAVPVFLIVYRLDLFEREPKLMLLAALLWGGVIATSLAAQANGAWLSIMGKVLPLYVTSDWGPAIVGPGVEETLKLMGVITLFLIVPDEFDGVMDGFVYGAMVGLGFTVVEDVSYFINATAAFAGTDSTGPVFDTFLIRVVAGGMYSHVLFTAITGMGFAYFATGRGRAMPKRLIGFGACVAAGVAAHVVWNSPWMQSILANSDGQPSTLQWIEYGAVKGMPFFVLLVILVVLATRSEEKNFRAIVAGEPDPQVLTELEMKSLGSLVSRRAARNAAGRLRGPKASRLTGQLQASQIEYAMIRSRVGTIVDPALDAQRLKIRGIRAQLATLPFATAPAAYAAVPGQAPATYAAAPGQAPAAYAAGYVPPAAYAPPGAAAQPAVPPTAPKASEPSAEPAHLAVEPPVQAVEPAAEAVEPAAPAKRGAEAVEPAAAAKPAAQAAQAAATPAAVAMPASTATPAVQAGTASPPAPATPGWAPTHLVPPGGMAAWAAPDPSRPPMVNLPERLELIEESRAGAWALVRAVNGWRGWVDGRRLIDRR